MEESDLLDVLLETEVVESDWQDVEVPTLTLTNTGVLCDTCGAVSLLKWHMSRSGFSYTCNKCRRKQSRRNAQKKYAKKMQKVHQVVRLKTELKKARKELRKRDQHGANTRRKSEGRNQEAA